MFRKEILMILVGLMLVGVYPVKGDLVFESGRSTFDDSYPFWAEVWVINDAVLDMTGGEIGKLGTSDFATINLYSGTVDWLWTGERSIDESVVNIWGGDINWLAAYRDTAVNLYAYDVQFHATGGGEWGNKEWIEGIYFSNNEPFALVLYNDDAYSHVNIVPETATILLVGFGGILLRKRG
ncbi:MAG TPA: hypothetical protein VJJ98_09755 [Sedimentisphaerales bacterium]|nr:hypothetical protein [Sedimentisphaerales bacterium]